MSFDRRVRASVRAVFALAMVAGAVSHGAARAAQGDSLATPSDTPSDTLGVVVPIAGVEVSTTRPGGHAPMARSVMSRDELLRDNTGQDTPMLLAKLPGAYASTDAGNGIGYTYLSIRAFPQRRISVLVNGVPLNDAQSHEVYWIDHPDLAASTREAEVQRGVGSALYGAASLGGSVNLETSPFTEGREARVSVDVGSYNTERLSLEMNSGRLAGDWNFYGRYSRIETNGYRDQSWSRLWSYALSARWAAARQSVRVNLYGGPEETHLAYLGVLPEYLTGAVTGDVDKDRRFNPITYANERDHFFEPHYELVHTWSPNPGTTFTQTLYAFDGRGYYDEQRGAQLLSDYRLTPWATADTTLFPHDYYADADSNGAVDRDGQGRATVERADLVRRRSIANRNVGWVPRVRFDHSGGQITVGGELRWADGRHYGNVISGSGLPPGTPPDAAYYDYRPNTLAAGVFAREEWRLASALVATADLAWRHEDYRMREDRFDGIRFDQEYDFVNPRVGLTWSPGTHADLYASWAHAGREPAFRDLYDGEGAGSVPLYRVSDTANNIYVDPLVTPETVDDYEAGATWRNAGATVAANLYHMSFRDEIVYAGQFNTDLGYPILGNAARSVHQGIELSARLERGLGGGTSVALDGNASLSDNHFVHYTDFDAFGNAYTYDGNAISGFPETLGHLGARAAWRALALGAAASYAGRIYLDNTEQREASIAPRTVLDVDADWAMRTGPGVEARLGVRVANVLDRRYETGGYMDYDAAGNVVPSRVPAAERNVIVRLKLAFR